MHRRSPWLAVIRQPLGLAATILLIIIAFLAVFAPVLWGAASEAIDTGALLQPPSSEHLLGTDTLGRDVLMRVLVATQLTVLLALAAVGIGVVVGTILGTAPSVLPRWMGRIIFTGVGIAVAFPGLLLALFFAVIFGVGATGAVLAIGFAMAPGFARLTQTLSASVAGQDYVAAARVAGVGRFRILVRHILPNIAEPLVVQTTISAGGALLAFAGLSFLGLGVQVPQFDWGRLLLEGINRIYMNPMAAFGPAVAIVVAGLSFNLLGETAAQVLGGRAANVHFSHSVVGAFRAAKNHQAPEISRDTADTDAVLVVDNLQVEFPGPHGTITPVRGVSFTIAQGESVGVVGESGSGKSLTALAVSRLIEYPGRVTADRLEFCDTEILHTPEKKVRHVLGTSLAMVFQDPMTSFNPTRRVGWQLSEAAIEHQGLDKKQAMQRAISRLQDVRVPAAARRARQYPHEYSGGMRQRAMIAMGLMNTPRLIIADEPTTALDVTVQRQVLRLLAAVRSETHAAILLISHDIAVVSQTCDRVLVMYAGRIVEDLPSARLHDGAMHPYTRALLEVVPELDTDRTATLPTIPGRPPAPGQFPSGCAFAARCPLATSRCLEEDPALSGTAEHRVACWNPVDACVTVESPALATEAQKVSAS